MSNSCLLFAPRQRSGSLAGRVVVRNNDVFLGSGYLGGLVDVVVLTTLCSVLILARQESDSFIQFIPANANKIWLLFQDKPQPRLGLPDPILSHPNHIIHHGADPTYPLPPPKKPNRDPKPKPPSPTPRIRLGVSFVRPPLCTAPPPPPPPPQCVLTGFSDARLRRRHTCPSSPRFLLPDTGRFGGRRADRSMSISAEGKREKPVGWVDSVGFLLVDGQGQDEPSAQYHHPV